MTLDHTKLDAYQRSLDLLDLIDQVHELMPRGRSHARVGTGTALRRSRMSRMSARAMVVRVVSMLARLAGA